MSTLLERFKQVSPDPFRYPSWIEEEEGGLKEDYYIDDRGNLTIGIGHLLAKKGGDFEKAKKTFEADAGYSPELEPEEKQKILRKPQRKPPRKQPKRRDRQNGKRRTNSLPSALYLPTSQNLAAPLIGTTPQTGLPETKLRRKCQHVRVMSFIQRRAVPVAPRPPRQSRH